MNYTFQNCTFYNPHFEINNNTEKGSDRDKKCTEIVFEYYIPIPEPKKPVVIITNEYVDTKTGDEFIIDTISYIKEK